MGLASENAYLKNSKNLTCEEAMDLIFDYASKYGKRMNALENLQSTDIEVTSEQALQVDGLRVYANYYKNQIINKCFHKRNQILVKSN